LPLLSEIGVYIQSGKTHKSLNFTNKDKPFCFLSHFKTSDSESVLRKNELFNVTDTYFTYGKVTKHLVAKSESSTIELICWNQWTITRDSKVIFEGTPKLEDVNEI
jgi:hypothetical protein